jgi:fructose-1,6-bisphosphatase II / sedoheptulose-1,7-bisphosphatase
MAMAEAGRCLNAPDVYMDKIAIGPGFKEGTIDLDAEPAENIISLAKAKGLKPERIRASFSIARATRRSSPVSGRSVHPCS